MMNANEPTTGELIEQLHTFDNVDTVTITIAKAALLFIADRLESQEHTIAALTARAEQAVRELDVLKLEFATIEEDGLCSVCKFESSIPLLQCMEDCCFKHRGLSVLSVDGVNGDGTERRGLPQEGEGK